MDEFRGSYDWIHRWEGHAGKPYFPGKHSQSYSGVTLDPGVDLGHVNTQLFERFYFPLFSKSQRRACRGAYGLTKRPAYNYLRTTPKIQSIRISRKQALEFFPVVARPYWEECQDRFTGVENAPRGVQTAMLSICYNRGSWNDDLEVCEGLIRREDWKELGRAIKRMQQRHRLKGIRRRRRAEGNLIIESADKKEKLAQDIELLKKVKPLPPTSLPFDTPHLQETANRFKS